MQVLGIFIGASFAELTVLDQQTQEKIFFQRWYLPRQGVRNQLQKTLQANPQLKPETAFVSSRFLEKIFDFRLGGSVAQLVTSGFEHWPYLSQSATHQNIFNAQRSYPISSPELTFAINERVGSNGQVLTPLAISELQAIHEKLKLMEIKKICLHFLHAEKNPEHLKQAEKFFTELEYEVFTPPNLIDIDETASWRQCTLNAAMTGTFNELRKELEEGLQSLIPPEKIYFLNSKAELFLSDKNHRLSTLFGIESLWSQLFNNVEIIDLGLEKFSYINTGIQNSNWKSHWGSVYLPHTQKIDFDLQPSVAIELNEWDELEFTKKTEGFEPGPMIFGRGQKPLLFDLFADEITNECSGLKENIHIQGHTRLQSALQALSRLKTQNKQSTVNEEIVALKNQVLDILATQIHFLANNNQVMLTGFFAPIFIKELSKRCPHLKLQLFNSQAALKSHQLALHGQKLKKCLEQN